MATDPVAPGVPDPLAGADLGDRPELARALLRGWMSTTPDYALVLIDAGGEIVGTLGGTERVLGYEAGELVGRSASLLFTPEDRALGLDRHELHIAAAAGRAEDDRWHLRKDGTRVWITGSVAAVLDDDGHLLGYVKALRNRTDLRAQIETLENRAAALAAADARRERFLGTLAHELRNPLSPLANASALIRLQDPQGRLREPLAIIDRQLAQLARLVDDMMDVARIDLGRLELRLQPLELQTAVAVAVEGVRPSAQSRGQSLELLLPPVPIVVEADPSRFEQVIANLVHNAVKYTPPGGHIWVKATVEGTTAVVRVTDDGMGIDADMLPRIFDLFTQERRAGAAAPGGLGIGLSLVKTLVQAHQGVVEVRSDGRDKGSEFTVRLPLRAPVAADA